MNHGASLSLSLFVNNFMLHFVCRQAVSERLELAPAGGRSEPQVSVYVQRLLLPLPLLLLCSLRSFIRRARALMALEPFNFRPLRSAR